MHVSRRFVFGAVLVLVTSAAAAQTSGDVVPLIGIAPTIDASRPFTWEVHVINWGPDVAQNVSVTGSTAPALATVCLPSSVNGIAPNTEFVFQCTSQPRGSDGDIVLHAHVSASNDPNPANDDATQMIHAIFGPDLTIVIGTPVIDPGIPFDIGLYYFNASIDVAASNATATVTLPPQIHVVKLPDECTQSAQVVTCSAGVVPAQKLSFAPPDATFSAVADDSTNGQVLHITADISTTDAEGNVANNHQDDPARVFRTFYVTDTTEDALGAAIDRANLECTDDYPCKVAFRLGTPPASGFFTFRPVNALPKITGKSVSIDGTTQTRRFGDTNPNGPEIFIDGSNSTSEDALVFDQPCAVELTGLAIGNFANAAVTMTADPASTGQFPCQVFARTRTVHDNYLGVDPSGTQPAPNGRGLVMTIGTTVTNNVISANRRSGIWLGAGFADSISGNRIGLDIHNQPLGNGASGIYAGPGVFDADIRGNYIAFNHDFGIAVDRRAVDVGIGPNSIFANWQSGIDIGLDGPTPDRDVPAPVVLSAQYDPATNTTLLTISSHEPPNGVVPNLLFQNYLPILTMYASDAPHPSGYGDGQYYLGSIAFDSTNGDVHFAAAGDWRGKWVTATVTRNEFNDGLFPAIPASTSEFGRAVKVQ